MLREERLWRAPFGHPTAVGSGACPARCGSRRQLSLAPDGRAPLRPLCRTVLRPPGFVEVSAYLVRPVKLRDERLGVALGERRSRGGTPRVRFSVAGDDVEVDVEHHLAASRPCSARGCSRGRGVRPSAELVQGGEARRLVLPREVGQPGAVPLRDHEQVAPGATGYSARKASVVSSS